MNATANEWIRTDREAVKKDIKRLGLSDAAHYQMDLIADRKLAGDTRWDGITVEQMVAELSDMMSA